MALLLSVPPPGPDEVVAIGVGKAERFGPHPAVAIGLAVLVGVLVFALLLKLRKTFGLRD